MHTRSFPAKAGNDGYAGTLATIRKKTIKMKEIREKIAQDKLEEAIEMLSDVSYKIDGIYKELLNQKGRLSRIKKSNRKGVVTYDENNIEVNKIRDAILELAYELEKEIKDDFAQMITIPPPGNKMVLKDISPFKIRKYPVTQYEWIEVMGKRMNRSGNRGNPNLPVENVSWELVQEFIERLNQSGQNKYRLPTEIEWEFACKAGFEGEFGFEGGEKMLEEYAWYSKNSRNTTHIVGGKKANAWGLHDMHGNVCEWVNDTKEVSMARNHSGIECITKGGSFDGNSSFCEASSNTPLTSIFRYDNIGFRLVSDI